MTKEPATLPEVIDTNLEVKERLLPVFFDMIQNQAIEGAKKYGHSDQREWTDFLSDAFGLDYFFMNIMKYIGRIRRNDPRAETDHAKIGTYIFLRWVKQYGRKYLEEQKKS